jgi:hypothetical protein
MASLHILNRKDTLGILIQGKGILLMDILNHIFMRKIK